MEVLTSIRWSHVPLLPAIPKTKVSNYQRLNWFHSLEFHSFRSDSEESSGGLYN